MHLLLTISQTTAITFPHVEYSGILPELLLIGGALLCMAISSMVKDEKKTPVFTSIGITVAVIAGAWSYHLYRGVESHGASTLVGGAMALDGFSTFLLVFICIGLVLTLLLGEAFIYRVGAPGPDFVSLLMLSASGAMFMASADDLIVLFLGLEILSISLYVLVAYTARRSASREAAFKYFILGGFSSAIFLYGIALTYGATGSTNIGQIELYLATNTITANGVLLAGLVLLIVGLGFKIAAVPFQLWTPDVYQGAPTTVTGFMAAIAKAAGFAGLLRLLFVPFATLRSDWRPIILVLSLLSLFAGALLALTQRDVKRMLAYSSINHAGFILLGLYVGTQRSVSDSLYYLFAYGIMAVGAFGMVSIVGAIRELP
ncbi:MAG: NADH-quinone oxidoreductase subunit N, partial [Acidimicrobiales bacterium]